MSGIQTLPRPAAAPLERSGRDIPQIAIDIVSLDRRYGTGWPGENGKDSGKESNEILVALVCDDVIKQQAAALALRNMAEAEHRLLSSEGFSKFMAQVYEHVFLLCHGQAVVAPATKRGSEDVKFTHATRGGIFAIQQLIKLDDEETEKRLIRFSNYIRIILQESETNVNDETLALAAEALGDMARFGENLTQDFVEFEANRALEWLRAAAHQESSSNFPLHGSLASFRSGIESASKRRKLAAVLVIKELAKATPVLFFNYVPMVFELIQTAIHDDSQVVRETAILALRENLSLALLRESSKYLQWFYNVYGIVKYGLTMGTAATVHGSLLALGELFLNSNNFMVPRFSEACETILRYKSHKSLLVRRTVILLIPELARFSSDAFVRKYLDDSIGYLFGAVNKPAESRAAFVALGRLAVAVSDNIMPHLAEIVLCVRETLVAEEDVSRRQAVEDSPGSLSSSLFQCISMLAEAVGPALLQHNLIDGLLNEMFCDGLSQPLILALSDLKFYIPQMKDLVMGYVLHSLSYTLSRKPFRIPPGGGTWPKGPKPDFKLFDIIEALESQFPAAIFLRKCGLGHYVSPPPVYSVAQGPGLENTSLVPSLLGKERNLSGLDVRDGIAGPSPHASLFFPEPTTGGSTQTRTTVSSSGNNVTRPQMQVSRSNRERELIILALRTLREFNFDRINLLPFLHDSVLVFVEDVDAEIRKEVAQTCAVLLLQDRESNGGTNCNCSTVSAMTGQGHSAHTSLANWDESARLMAGGVRRLLQLGVSDPEAAIRCEFLNCFKENAGFDAYIIQEDTLQALFVALQDENFEVRRVAMSIASRLASRNPILIQPAVRKCILAAMAQLAFSPSQSYREEGAVILLGDVVSGLSTSRLGRQGAESISPLIAPCVVSLINLLMDKLRVVQHSMSTSVLRTLGQIASMEGVSMVEYQDRLMPLLVSILLDQGSAEKRRYALWALGQLVRSTGLVVKPLLKFPDLLDTLLTIIKRGSEAPWELREEALRTLGTLGALDPFEIKAQKKIGQGATGTVLKLEDDSEESNDGKNKGKRKERANTAIETSNAKNTNLELDAFKLLRPKDEDYYPTVAIEALLRILQDSALKSHHSMVIQALTQMFRSLALTCVTFLPRVVPCILEVATVCEKDLRRVLFQNISVTVSITKQYIRPYLDDIMDLILRYWYENLDQILQLIERIALVLKEEFVPYANLILPNLLDVLEILCDEQRETSSGLISTTFGRTSEPHLLSAAARVLKLGGDARHRSVRPSADINATWSSSVRSGVSLNPHGTGRVRRMSDRRSPGGPDDIQVGGRSMTSPMHGTSVNTRISSTVGAAREATRAGVPRVINTSTVEKPFRQHDLSAQRRALKLTKGSSPAWSRRIFKTLKTISFILTGHFYLVIPALVDVVEGECARNEVRVNAVHALGTLSSDDFFSDYAQNAMQCLIRLLRSRTNEKLKCQAVDTLCVFCLRFPALFVMFKDTIENSLKGRSVMPYSLERYSRTLKLVENTEVSPTLDKEKEDHIAFLLSADYTIVGKSATFGAQNGTMGGASGPLKNAGSAVEDINVPQNLLQVNQVKLQVAWRATTSAAADEWVEWMRRISVELLRESPSPALRACSAVAQVYNPLSKELFNAAFVSCWGGLDEPYQDDFVRAMNLAFNSAFTPPETLQTLLDLAEFMEHDERVFPIGLRDLGDYAQRCHAYAKALHYKEMVFRKLPGACTEGLISINNKLEQPEAAVGILHYVQQLQKRQLQVSPLTPAGTEMHEVNMLDFGVAVEAISPHISSTVIAGTRDDLFENNSAMYDNGSIRLRETWFEKLGRWEEALASYEDKLSLLEDDPSRTYTGENLDNMMGKVRCLFNLGEYDQIMDLATYTWEDVVHSNALGSIAPIFCRSAWLCGDWAAMEKFSTYIPEQDLTGYFLRAVLALQRNDFVQSRLMIDQGRTKLGEILGALAGESYDRAYRQIVSAQQFAELDEIFLYKRKATSGQYNESDLYRMRENLGVIWSKRVHGCQESVAVWNEVLGTHTLVLPPHENKDTLIKFSTICRKSGRLRICLRILESLGIKNEEGFDITKSTVDPGVAFAFLKFRWAEIKASTSNRQGQMFGNAASGGHRASISVVPLAASGQGRTRLASFAGPNTRSGSLLGERVHGRPADIIAQLTSLTQSLESQVEHGDSHANSSKSGLLARCYLKLATWKFASEEYNLREDFIASVLGILKKATELEEDNYKAWHAWALMNFRAVQFFNRKLLGTGSSSEDLESPAKDAAQHEGRYETILEDENESDDDESDESDESEADVKPWDENSNGSATSEPSVPHRNLSTSLGLDRPNERFGGAMNVRNSNSKNHKTNSKAVSPREQTQAAQEASEEKKRLHQKMQAFIAPAIHGFSRSIALGQRKADSRNVLQDILRLLTLWFSHGSRKDVEDAIVEGFKCLQISTWLDVVPQLIARVHSNKTGIRKVLHQLVVSLSLEHPHALVYPLTVAAKSMSESRRTAAESILEELRSNEEFTVLIDQAQLVSTELNHVAILWEEEWYGVLELASTKYFDEQDFSGAVELIRTMYDKTINGPTETIHQKEFKETHGLTLRTALQLFEGALVDPHEYRDQFIRAWQLCKSFTETIKIQDRQRAMQLDLEKVSHTLYNASNLQLAIPGTYVPGRKIISINGFNQTIRVIQSKQRPRQISMYGSDGEDYMFLLKGHEDLRQDERVMQLIGLVNTLLDKERETNKYNLSITRYSVIPLSHHAGITQWLANTDTLHALIEKYRTSHKVYLDIEMRLIAKLAPKYESLTVIQKVEAFSHALACTDGQEIGKTLWLKSRNSEIWFERRTAFTRSLATMSMVGYILGLGDRHPSNLMLDRETGKIIHIDYGDCFDVARTRSSYPEKVPFRLTRMLIAAMEVSGLEGNFRYTCESVMRVLRNNQDSVVALLEAFVHDPLINWRLLTPADTIGIEDPANADEGRAGTPPQNQRRGPLNRTESNPAVSTVWRDADVLSRSQHRVVNNNSEQHDQLPAFLKNPNLNGAVRNRPRAATEVRLGQGSISGGPQSAIVRNMRETWRNQVLADSNNDVLNQRALDVLERINHKLTGMDFAIPRDVDNGDDQNNPESSCSSSDPLSSFPGDPQADSKQVAMDPAPIPLQVQRLLVEATLNENLCQAFSGWCAIW